MTRTSVLLAAGCLASSLLFIPLSWAADSAAEALARKSGCFKCHAVDKEKVAPSYREIISRYKGDADAEQKLFTHLTTGPTVKVDGEDEVHASLKTDDEEQVRRVVRWILSL